MFAILKRIFAVISPIMQQQITFPSGKVDYYFQETVNNLPQLHDSQHVLFITDEHIAQLYPDIFKERKTLVIPYGEGSKDLNTIASLADQLLSMETTRNTLLIGIGGGVVTDITGFLASVYMRGVNFGYVPTSLLGMVDAAIGGKNGVNVGLHKNMLGTFRQPEFILYNSTFLATLPDDEWSNGFAEVIKYASIFDADMFDELCTRDIAFYKNDIAALDSLIRRCVAWKNKTVQEDEHDDGPRKLLNFGHTVGHAIEKLCELPHGKAVGIGMVVACMISEAIMGNEINLAQQMQNLLQRYHLPTHIDFDIDAVMELLKTDKKRNDHTIDYIILRQPGSAFIQPLPLHIIEKVLRTYESNS